MSACGDKVATHTGYQRHKRAGEDACGPCLEAHREYFRQRRAGKKHQDPPAAEAAPAIEVSPRGVSFVAVAHEGGDRWSTSYGAVDPETRVQVLTGGDTLPGDRLLDSILRHVVGGTRIVLCDTAESLQLRELIPDLLEQVASRDGKVVLTTQRRTKYSGDQSTLAEDLAKANVNLVLHGEQVREDRVELDRELTGEVPEHRVAAATVARGKMFKELGRFEKAEPVYEPIPYDHPARHQESWVGVVKAPKPRRGRWTGGR